MYLTKIENNTVKHVREKGLDKFYTIPTIAKQCIGPACPRAGFRAADRTLRSEVEVVTNILG